MRIPDYPMSDQEMWTNVDSYFSQVLCPSDDILDATLTANAKAGMPAHDVSATQGKLLALFVQMLQAQRVLEIGTLGGYSTIWMARKLRTGGKIVTIEADQHHAEVALENLKKAAVSDLVDLHIGAALDVLPTLEAPFDLIFIDADKKNNPEYLQWALKLSRPGTVIIADNIVRGGGVINSDSEDINVQGVRKYFEMVKNDPRLDATAIQTVGEKGWDGFSMAIVNSL